MLNKHLRTLLIIAILPLLLLSLLPSSMLAAPHRSVTLTYFTGEGTAGGARLDWQTATELDTAGFWIKRATNSGGPFNKLDDIGLVAGQGSATSGSTYEAVDETAETGQTYWYQLVEVEYNGSEHALQTIPVTAGAMPTATVQGIATSDSGDATEASAGATATTQSSPTTGSTTVTTTPRSTSTIVATATGPAGTTTGATSNPPNATARVVGGDGIAEAAGPTRDEPLILAQATGAYPGPTVTEEGPSEDESYPGPAPVDTPTPAISTVESYPSGIPAEESTQEVGAGNRVDNTVGGSSENTTGEESGVEGSGALSRVLLWLGFVAALLIFVAGAVFSVILSTRKQPPHS